MSESPKVVIDDQEFSLDNFTEEQKYFVSQLSDIHRKKSELEFQMAQLNAAHQTFTAVLKQSVEEPQDVGSTDTQT
tara:strand:+ start:913 stop:1140 length:228 start_codon:yes stop_codon:yes gene_type:complete